MREDASAYEHINVLRNVLVELWTTSTPAEILGGLATDEFDLSPYVYSVRTTQNKLSIELRYNTQFLDCAVQPKPGHLVTVKTDGLLRFHGAIDTIDSFTEERGTRSISLSVRLRDGFGGWRTQHATSQIFPQGTAYNAMLENICETLMGLSEYEYIFPTIGYSVPHTNAQLADETAWNMLNNVLFASDMIPYVDVLNRVRAHDKNVGRDADMQIATHRVVKLHGSRETAQTSRIRLRWLDANLSKSYQQNQQLYETAMTAGFFDRVQDEEAWFSTDHTQRAEDTYMIIRDSVNAGLLTVADEDYYPVDLYHGIIRLHTYWWVPTLAFAGLAAITAAALIPDGVSTAPGQTSPLGRVLETAGTVSVMLTMMSMGVGRYEIWGTPFDYVHQKNTTLIIAENVAEWAASEDEIENDLIVNEEHAQLIAINHLVWLAAQSHSFGATLVDDPRIEVGDIIEFDDGSRLWVNEFSNDFTRGKPATITVKGYRV